MAADSVGSDVKAAFFAGLAFVGLILAIDNATIGWLLVPLPVFAFLFAMLKAPMRASLLTLMFFGLALENPSEMPASDAWRSPFFEFGAVMLSHFKHSVGI